MVMIYKLIMSTRDESDKGNQEFSESGREWKWMKYSKRCPMRYESMNRGFCQLKERAHLLIEMDQGQNGHGIPKGFCKVREVK